MACTDGGVPYPEEKRPNFEAILCGVFSAFHPGPLQDLLNIVNWKEVGVTQEETETWWKKHKQSDIARKKHEAESKKREKLMKSALAKLSPKEREALGL